jgi:phosphomannomutase
MRLKILQEKVLAFSTLSIYSIIIILLVVFPTTQPLVVPLTNLLSGSDIRGEVGVSLTTEATIRIGRSLGRIFKTQSTPCPRCIIGHDPRIHGEELVFHLMQGLSSVGCRVDLCKSVTTTPSMFYATTTSKYDGAIMVTASHLPADKNGFKMYIHDPKYMARGLEKEEVRKILEDAEVNESNDDDSLDPPPPPMVVDFVPTYQSHLIETFRRRTSRILPLKNLNVVLSTGCGSGFIVSRVFRDLGANVMEVGIGKK